MDNDIASILSYFNLSPKEAAVYLAALKSGPATVYEIAKSAGIKRPTAYVLAESLKEKGLLTSQKDRHRELLSPIAPRQFITSWKNKLESLEAVAPELNAYYERTSTHPRISIYEGRAGLDAAYNQMLYSRGMRTKEELLSISTISVIMENYSHLFPAWKRTVHDKRNRMRDLICDEPISQSYGQEMLALGNPNYELRIAKNIPIGKTDTFIYRNKVAMFWFTPPFTATVTESDEVAQTFRALFNVAWVNARKI